MKKILFFKTNPENTSLIEELSKKKELNITCNYYTKIFLCIGGNRDQVLNINGENISTFDKIYFYGVSNNLEIACAISQLLAKDKSIFFDTFVINSITNNKLADTCRAYSNGISIPRTVFLSNDLLLSGFSKVKENLSLPFVMKTTIGNKGTKVWLIENEKDFLEAYKSNTSETFIFQEYIENKFDYRINILGGKVSIITKRTRTTDIFRNNTHLGATEEFFLPGQIDPNITSIAEKMSSLCNIQIAGVDIIQSSTDNKFYFLEINKDPGITVDSPEFDTFYKFLME